MRQAIAGPGKFLLLHGQGATGAVWSGVLRGLTAMKLTAEAPDLAGHGEGERLEQYTLEGLARCAARNLAGGRVLAIGHSLGGYVALALAGGGYGVEVDAVLSLGAKINFSSAERARLAELATKPARRFATREEALDRYRKVSGLGVDVAPDETLLARGVRAADQGFELAADPRSLALVVPSFATLRATARCPVMLARGERDALVSRAEQLVLDPQAVDLPELGHNAHVEAPDTVLALIAALTDQLA
jgi:pimeloyl-ACP methyl ester carboxylesterase